MIVARKLRVTGTVQGVFYRAWTRDQARDLGLTGWVRNCPDGSVEAHLEGNENAVTQMVKRMRQGPPAAQVEDVEVRETEPEGLGRFEVRH